ncbi:hypothetical protein Salat_0409100 [Sesamum alatum]|uniref:Uncharacterized protein n=1 Tax=Sesamum alatum TaxID=300844 RepID=A0AAE1Z2G8_9LAMI|nr:hypothetical protein Salat_0409100 [Sesamum alatum]
MAHTVSLTIFYALLLFAHPIYSQDSPESSPSPSPEFPPGDISQPPASPSPSPALPISPPAPPPSDLAPNSPSPAPFPGEDDDAPYEQEKTPSPAPAPAPVVVGDVRHEDQSNAGDLETNDDSSGGMSGGKKAGVAIGVISAACVVGLGALVYKKRQQNIRRAQYGYAARGEFL